VSSQNRSVGEEGAVPKPIRQAVRALILDDDWSALLVHLRFPTWSGWVLPGGGIDEGEDTEAALHRELAEELGLVGSELSGPIWKRTVLWGAGGAFAGQSEEIYLLRSARFEPNPRLSWDELRAEGVTAIRWWSPDELAACDEVLAPTRLPELIADLARSGVPPSTIDVGE
jgi:8-oxo-dGTP diphosphatase